MSLLKWMWRGLPLLALALSATTLRAEAVQVGGVGSLTPLLKQLAVEYKKSHPKVDVHVIDPPIGSTGGLRALAAGKIDVALSGRPLQEKESGDLRPWVHTALVLATSDAPEKGLDSAQLTRIYNGEVKTWSGGQPLRLILRGAFESETLMLRQLSPEMDAAVSAALKRRDAPVADNDLSALDLIGKISGSLGSTSLGLVLSTQSTVRLIPLNGKVPSVDTLATGGYPWTRPYYLVSRADTSPAVRDFVAYLMSESAFKLARKLGYLPFKG